MKQTDLESKISRGKELFSEIIRLITDFVERLDDLSPAEIHSFEIKRGDLLKDLITHFSDFKKELSAMDGALPVEMEKKVEEFRIFQEVFVQIVMDKGAEIISRATEMKDLINRDISVITGGKNALRGYDGKRGVASHSVNNSA